MKIFLNNRSSNIVKNHNSLFGYERFRPYILIMYSSLLIGVLIIGLILFEYEYEEQKKKILTQPSITRIRVERTGVKVDMIEPEFEFEEEKEEDSFGVGPLVTGLRLSNGPKE